MLLYTCYEAQARAWEDLHMVQVLLMIGCCPASGELLLVWATHAYAYMWACIQACRGYGRISVSDKGCGGRPRKDEIPCLKLFWAPPFLFRSLLLAPAAGFQADVPMWSRER